MDINKRDITEFDIVKISLLQSKNRFDFSLQYSKVHLTQDYSIDPALCCLCEQLSFQLGKELWHHPQVKFGHKPLETP